MSLLKAAHFVSMAQPIVQGGLAGKVKFPFGPKLRTVARIGVKQGPVRCPRGSIISEGSWVF